MKKNISTLFMVPILVLSYAYLFSGNVIADSAQISIIVHPSAALKTVSKKEVANLFLAKTDSIQGVKLEPVNQNPSQAIRIVFDEDVLGKTPSKMSAYWARMIFTARGAPPPEFDSNAAIIKWVAEHPDSIAYIENSTVNDSVSVLKSNF